MLMRSQQQTADYTPIQRVERDSIETHQPIGAGVVANTAPWAEARAGISTFGPNRFDGFNCLGLGTDGPLRAETKVQARLAIHPMEGGIGVGNTLIPAHLRYPRRGLVEGALCRGQCHVMAVKVQLDTEGAVECFVHLALFYHRQLVTDWQAV